MNRKIIALLMVLIFTLCCVSIAFAENDTGDDFETATEDVEVEDTSNYIRIVSVSNGEIQFNDGFTGFSLDSTKSPQRGDTFTQGSSSNSQIENYIKLAIIEACKQGKENSLGQIISKIVDNNLDTGDNVINEVVNSNEHITDNEVVNIDNTTEGTFTFELLKSTDDDKADCLAYKVSLRTVKAPIGATDDTAENGTGDADKDTATDDKNNDTSSADKTGADDKKSTTKENDKKETVPENNATDKTTKTNDTDINKTKEKPKQDNETIVNKTTTVTTIENNTTIIHNNVKEVNNTTAPENNTITELLKAGNPILILIIVVVIAVIAVVVMKRKE